MREYYEIVECEKYEFEQKPKITNRVFKMLRKLTDRMKYMSRVFLNQSH